VCSLSWLLNHVLYRRVLLVALKHMYVTAAILLAAVFWLSLRCLRACTCRCCRALDTPIADAWAGATPNIGGAGCHDIGNGHGNGAAGIRRGGKTKRA
jgi:hypothetical protein